MPSRPRLTLLMLLTAAAIIPVLLLPTLPTSEPTYKGLTIRAWLSRPPGQERNEALRIIGTNNLPFLVRRLGYDPAADPVFRLYTRLPRSFQRSWWLYDLVAGRLQLANDAQYVLILLGPAATPVVAELTQIARNRGQVPFTRALVVLDSLGEKGHAGIITLIGQTNQAKRIVAMVRLAPYTNSPAAWHALTNALDDPDPQIRKQADDILAGRAFE